MERENDARLQALLDQGIELYSISKLDSINTCLYASYLTYRKDDRGNNNIYAMLGTKMHEVLEQIAKGEATEADLMPALKSELLDMELFGFKFPTEQIKNGWIQDMTNFCNTYKMAEGRYATEELFIYKTDDGHYIRGYIDLIDQHFDGTIDIYDHKSSSMYSSASMEEHARQLLVYMLAKQQEGYKVNKIAWHFMKYVEVIYRDAKGKSKSRIIERRKIYEETKGYVEKALEAEGYDEFDIDIWLTQLQMNNTFDGIPLEGFEIKPAIIEYEVTQEAIDECKKYIADTIAKWEALEDKDESAYIPREFTKTQKNGKVVPDLFYCTQICSHMHHCSHVHQYLEEHPLPKKEDEV